MKPILFNTEMVRAILDDRKTVTRRVIRSSQAECSAQPPKAALSARVKYKHSVDPTKTLDDFIGTSDPQLLVSCAPYKTGDVLYVRETWYYESHMYDESEGAALHRYIYKASNPDYPVNVGVGRQGWRPSIHMPKEAARLFLRVTDVRVERLHDITDAGAVAEGIKPEILLCSFRGPEFPEPLPDEPIGCVSKFIELWDSTIKPADFDRYGWRANPWVWTIGFERISKEQAMTDKN